MNDIDARLERAAELLRGGMFSVAAEAVEEARRLLAGSLGFGWFCPRCHVFNGDAKVRLEECRVCGEQRP
jgi:hypothetical protein